MFQIAYSTGSSPYCGCIKRRYATSSTTWSAWMESNLSQNYPMISASTTAPYFTYNFFAYHSTPIMANMTNQGITSGLLTVAQSGSVVGNYVNANVSGTSGTGVDMVCLPPNWGIVMYTSNNYAGSICLNTKNTTSSLLNVGLNSYNNGFSFKLYYCDIEITALM
jgi:hypothetical protein